MGILIISILLVSLAIGFFIGVGKNKLGDWAIFVAVFAIVIGFILPLAVFSENRWNEEYHISRYNKTYLLSQVTTDDFESACYIKNEVDAMNEVLKGTKKFNSRNEFMWGLAKEKTFAQYEYIEYKWKK